MNGFELRYGFGVDFPRRRDFNSMDAAVSFFTTLAQRVPGEFEVAQAKAEVDVCSRCPLDLRENELVNEQHRRLARAHPTRLTCAPPTFNPGAPVRRTGL